MPKEIKDLKTFLEIVRKEKAFHPKVKKIIIKKNKNNVTKFKLRTAKQLITFVADGADRVEKVTSKLIWGIGGGVGLGGGVGADAAADEDAPLVSESARTSATCSSSVKKEPSA